MNFKFQCGLPPELQVILCKKCASWQVYAYMTPVYLKYLHHVKSTSSILLTVAVCNNSVRLFRYGPD